MDEGLILIIQNMPQLQSLNLFENQLTSDGVKDIYLLRNLKKLDVCKSCLIQSET